MLEIPSRPFERDNIPFEQLFNPRAIVVIGASINLSYGGSQFVFTIKTAGYPHPIYPVNPKYVGKELAGYKFYGSVSSLPDDPPIDLAILAVPAKIVPSIIEELGKKKIPFAHIFSSGFAELGEEGKVLEESIIKIASIHGVRILGPNCMGIHNPRAKITFLMMAADLTEGNLGFISQSGGIAVSHGMRAPSLGYHHSKLISVGNQIDLDILDFLRYFKDDPETKVIAMYIENVKRGGHEFVQLLKETTLKKPVIIWKGGRFKTGVQAVMSHTGGLAGNYKLWQAMAKQTGAILVSGFSDLIDQIRTCLAYSIPKTLGTALISGSGGFAVEMTDKVEEYGLSVPPLSKDAYEKINQFVPETNSNLKNPLEFGANNNLEICIKTIKILDEESQYSLILMTTSPEFYIYRGNMNMEQVVDKISDGIPKNKILAGVGGSFSMTDEGVRLNHIFKKLAYSNAQIVIYDSTEAAAKCFYRWWQYGQYLEKKKASNTEN